MVNGVATERRGQSQALQARHQSGRKLRMGFVLDVAGYGARTAPMQNDIQRRLPPLVSSMLAQCGMDLDSVEHEWRGDGINAVMPADMDPTIALPVMIRSLAAQLGSENTRSAVPIRLRMAVGIGLVEHSGAGFGGPMIVDINRLVSSGPLRAALTGHPAANLAVAISDQVHSAIIRPGYTGIPGTQFTQVNVVEKEFAAPAWIWISDRQWSAPAYQPLSRQDPRQIGRYRIAARLGSGAAGQVYLGKSSGGTPLAVKLFAPDIAADAEARDRLASAVAAADRLRGPQIAHMTDSDPESPRPWVASTLAAGPSLASVIAETGPLPAASAAWLALGVARALATIHEAGLIHEALTPPNVLLCASDPVVTDLGVSKNALIETPADNSDDLFALGCLIFFSAVGRSPFGDYPYFPCVPATAGEPDLDGCPPGLLLAVQACLSRDPAQRPGPRAMITRLLAVAGEPPRSWLPAAVTARVSDYKQFPEPAPPPWWRLPSQLGAGLRGTASRLSR
jgi:hypothetical protein